MSAGCQNACSPATPFNRARHRIRPARRRAGRGAARGQRSVEVCVGGRWRLAGSRVGPQGRPAPCSVSVAHRWRAVGRRFCTWSPDGHTAAGYFVGHTGRPSPCSVLVSNQQRDHDAAAHADHEGVHDVSSRQRARTGCDSAESRPMIGSPSCPVAPAAYSAEGPGVRPGTWRCCCRWHWRSGCR